MNSCLDEKESEVYYSNRAAALMKLNKYDQAYTDCKRGVELNPNFLKVVRRLFSSCVALGKYDEAKAILNEYMVSHPKEKGFKEDLRTLADIENLKKQVEFAESKGDPRQEAHWLSQLQ